MTRGQHGEIDRTWVPHLWLAFVFIITAFVVSGIFSIYVMWHTQREIELIDDHALASIELVFRLSDNIEAKRRLLEAHVVETTSPGMKEIETQLSAVDTRITARARDYEPTISDDAERRLWEELQAKIAAAQPKIERIIELSRENQDVQARAAMKGSDPQLDDIDQTMNSLVRLNSQRAAENVVRIRALHRTAGIILIALIVVLTAFSLLVARWVTLLIKQRENGMNAAMSLLEERNRELDAFAGRVAHDLRGPLTTINLAAFAREGAHEERASAAFRRGVRQMETIIQDLLTLSRISAVTARGNCQVSAVFASAEEDLRQNMHTAGGVLLCEITPATVPCSEGLLRQVLWNLVENAVKYRRSGVRLGVEIRGRISNHTYELTVSDNGMGMSPSEAQRAFEPFFRGENVQSTPGTGLGLSIAKRVVEAGGGSISVESRVGQGTTFKIRLPLAVSKAA